MLVSAIQHEQLDFVQALVGRYTRVRKLEEGEDPVKSAQAVYAAMVHNDVRLEHYGRIGSKARVQQAKDATSSSAEAILKKAIQSTVEKPMYSHLNLTDEQTTTLINRTQWQYQGHQSLEKAIQQVMSDSGFSAGEPPCRSQAWGKLSPPSCSYVA